MAQNQDKSAEEQWTPEVQAAFEKWCREKEEFYGFKARPGRSDERGAWTQYSNRAGAEYSEYHDHEGNLVCRTVAPDPHDFSDPFTIVGRKHRDDELTSVYKTHDLAFFHESENEVIETYFESETSQGRLGREWCCENSEHETEFEIEGQGRVQEQGFEIG